MTFDFAVRDHLELGSLLDVLDFETGAKVCVGCMVCVGCVVRELDV